MSNEDRQGWASGPAVNQFGTPVNQLGSPTGRTGAAAQSGSAGAAPFSSPGPVSGSLGGSLGGPVNQFGSAAAFGASSPQQWSARPARRSGAGWAVGATALALVVLGGVLVRTYVFPDLSKPIDLPGTVASVATLSEAPGQPITVQSKDSEGRATAMSVYADDTVSPQTMLVVTAGRTKDFGTERVTETTRTIGKVTCTDNVATARLMAQAGASRSAGAAAMAGLKTGAACWRTGRHLTVMVVALTAHDAAQSTARQAVSEAWDAL